MTTHRTISSGSKWEPLLGYSRAVVAGLVDAAFVVEIEAVAVL